ncbi:MAG TPA: hypothetical protein VID29_08175 [Solirubrobacteraceae bacterium]
MDAAAPCATCGAPMAPDQRYCLQCGSRGSHLPGVHEGLRASTAASGALPGALREGTGGASAVSGHESALPAPGAPAPANNTLSVIAGVGVLLLAMGIGVLIGRADSGSGVGRAAAAPQVISVAAPGTGAGAASTPASAAPLPGGAAKKGKSSSSSSSSSVGQSLSKPAPASVLQNLHTGGSGQTYEQKSKNLPNVISTG